MALSRACFRSVSVTAYPDLVKAGAAPPHTYEKRCVVGAMRALPQNNHQLPEQLPFSTEKEQGKALALPCCIFALKCCCV